MFGVKKVKDPVYPSGPKSTPRPELIVKVKPYSNVKSRIHIAHLSIYLHSHYYLGKRCHSQEGASDQLRSKNLLILAECGVY
jgi:hypothetical protein